MFTLPNERPTSLVFLMLWTMKYGLSYARVSYCDVAVGWGYRYERCRPVVGSRYSALLNSGDVRNAPSRRPDRFEPFWMNEPCVSAKFTVAPMRSFSFSSRLPFTRAVVRPYLSFSPMMYPSCDVLPRDR